MAEWGWDRRAVWDPPRTCGLFVGSPVMCPPSENAKWELILPHISCGERRGEEQFSLGFFNFFIKCTEAFLTLAGATVL